MSDFLDDIDAKSTDITEAVGCSSMPDIMTCPYIACVRIAVVNIENNERLQSIIDKMTNVIHLNPNITDVSDIEINCRAERQKCGSVPIWVMTDNSVYLCFGFTPNFKSPKSLNRFLRSLVNITYFARWDSYDYEGIVFYRQEDKETHVFYTAAKNILGTSTRLTTYEADLLRLEEYLNGKSMYHDTNVHYPDV